MKILITSGGTEEPIDGVRSISNFSTGKTGKVIADLFYNKGTDVVLLKGKRAVSPNKNIKTIEFLSFKDLNSKVKDILTSENFDAVIHLAAVSDFSIEYLESDGQEVAKATGKIDSSKPLTIHLKPNFKILDHLKEYANNNLFVIGFKLTKNEKTSKIEQKVANMFKNELVDLVVHNDLSEITLHRHPANIYKKTVILKKTETKEELAGTLYKMIKEKLNGTMS